MVVEWLLMILWQSPIIYFGHEWYSATWQKTDLSISKCYLPATSSSVCLFIFLPALFLAGWFLPGQMILTHVHTILFFFLHIKQAIMWPKGCSYSFSDPLICDVVSVHVKDLTVTSNLKVFNASVCLSLIFDVREIFFYSITCIPVLSVQLLTAQFWSELLDSILH